MNSFMYPDDIILLAITVNDIQNLVNLSVEQFGIIGLKITKKISKSENWAWALCFFVPSIEFV